MSLLAVMAILGPALVGIMVGAWLLQKRTGNIGWVDVVWTFGTGAIGACAALIPSPTGAPMTWRQIVVAGLACVWSIRLGIHVALRVARTAEDRRYVALRATWGKGLQPRLFWFLQAQAMCATLLAVAMFVAAHNPAPAVRLLDIAAIAVLVAAICGEALADRQLQCFTADPDNKGRVCNVGLWAWSRHPNYFFEWIVWLAYPLFAFGADYPQGWLAWLAPAVMYAVLVHGTGIPPLEEHMSRSRGGAWDAYRQRTSIFLPIPPWCGRRGKLRP